MDSLAISGAMVCITCVPLKSYVKAFSNFSFAPQGATDDPEVKTATSLVDTFSAVWLWIT